MKLTIQRRLLVGTALSTILFVSIVILCVTMLSDGNKQLKQLVDKDMVRLQLCQDISRGMLSLIRDEKELLLAPTDFKRERISWRLEETQKDILVRIARLRAMENVEEISLKEFETRWRNFRKNQKLVEEELSRGSRDSALALSRGAGRDMAVQAESVFRNITEQVTRDLIEHRKKGESSFQNARSLLLAFLIPGILVLLLPSYWAIAGLRKRLKTIARKASYLASRELRESEFQEEAIPDEFVEVGQSLQEIYLTFKDMARQSQRIAMGDYTAEIKPRSQNDELGIALKKMTGALQEFSSKVEYNNWLKVGVNELNNKMRGLQEVEDLARTVVSYLCGYINAQMGAIYLAEIEKKQIRLVGSYAFANRKKLNSVIKYGEGLAGEVAFENEMILLTDIPDNYTPITSALGEAPPRNILAFPLKHDDSLVGVLELASVAPIAQGKLDYIKLVSENIAVAISSATSRREMGELLTETQRQAGELQLQQEELRVANESLQVQQEELRVANEELEEKSNELELQRQKVIERNRALIRAGNELKKKAEELESSSRYKSEFLANMSHELRTPLNSLLLLAKKLSKNTEKNLTEKQVMASEIIFSSGNSLLTLINDILDLSRIEAGKMVLHVEAVSFIEIKENLNNMFSHVFRDKGVNFVVRIDADLPPFLRTDREKFNQVLRNLVANAAKFTEVGEVVVDFLRPMENETGFSINIEPEKMIEVRVRDTGIGIAEEEQAQIFEAFRQADGGTARKFGGTGLGLSIARRLAELLGGGIRLRSETGRGAEFTVILSEHLAAGVVEVKETAPRSFPESSVSADSTDLPGSAAPAKPAQSLRPAPSLPDDRGELTPEDKIVLVVEDDLNFAQILYDVCKERNYKFIHAGDGMSGIELAERFSPQAIILDIKLPDMLGDEVLKKLKNNMGTRHIPVQIMSANESTEELMKSGAFGFLQKPVTGEQLDHAFEKIRTFLSRELKELLIVEDDDVLRNEIESLFESDKVHISRAKIGFEALQLLEKERYDCMILDLTLPDMTGFEVLDKIDSNPNISSPPVIIYSGRELSDEEQMNLKQNARAVVLKDAMADERLLDEVSLFLHAAIEDLPVDSKKKIEEIYDDDAVLAGKRVLIVDDDMRNLFAVTEELEAVKIEVTKATNGEKALEVLDADPGFDMVLMDIMMPVMDGYEAMRKIRERSNLKNLSIIALTAKAMKEDRGKCIDAGANDYLSKPLEIDKLLSTMRVWMKT